MAAITATWRRTNYWEGALAHLTDMEELLAKIQGADTRDYMRESMNCYMAGAYRGSLVLSYIALFDDLLAKLGELANVNASAKTTYIEATKKKADQDVYESYLIDQLTSKSLLSGLDSSFLTTLRTLRNKSAHPSGHKPSPEEARFIFFETIDRFLSKPVLSTTHLVDEIVTRLKNTNFFPSTSISDVSTVVVEELATLHEEAVPQLVVKLVASVTSSDAGTSKNASFFLIGLSKLDKPIANASLQNKLLASKADDSAFHDVVIQIISANGKLAIGLSTTTSGRLRAVLATKISEITSAVSETNLSHPTSALASLAAALPETDFVVAFKPELVALFEKRSHSEFVVKLVADRPSLLPIFVPILLAKAGSSDFATANSFSNAVDKLDASLSALLPDEQAFHLIVAILQAAKWGAWSPKAVVSAKFAGIPVLRAKAIAYMTSRPTESAEILKAQIGETKPVIEFIAATLTDEETAVLPFARADL